ncbi:SET domain-containing protein [Fusarium mundagurra]|uniref:SET domain-containing protein n=1 Tax=Fusarium mundagurra TaxID=1567541 RepID=A0A8H5YNE4_9HYPO|nr:SET domain-containing protein [Fusarium mundagurra]
MLQRVQRLLHLLAGEEINDATVPWAYCDAFQIAITHGDQARAKIVAERALSPWMLIKRYDSPEVKKLQKLSNDPSQHASHGFTTKLVFTVEGAPADMKGNDFEDWLWSEKKCDNQQFIHFRDEAAIPAFENLPDEDNVDLDFFQTEDGFSIGLGEIGFSWAR